MEQAYHNLKMRHSIDIVFIIIGVAIIGGAIYVKQPILIIIALVPLLLGLFTFFALNKQMKELNYIRHNYKTDATTCLQIINKKIEVTNHSINVNEFRSEIGRRGDRQDSMRDVKRHTKVLEVLEEMKAEIEKYIPVDFSTY